jgi:autoinducer 2 (AI-2) kinase
MIIDRNGELLGIARRLWSYSTPEALEIAKEFDPHHFWKLICEVIRESISSAKIPISDIEGVATTSQRHGIVLLDDDGNELHGGPNIDARGAMMQFIIEDSLGESYHEITGCWPPLMFAPTRVAWFEEEEPELFSSIASLLPINDWVTYRLSGEAVTEPSAASSTGFFDIEKGVWSTEVISAIGIDSGILPEVRRAGEVVGEVSKEAERECGLPQGLTVVQGGADTHCALLACQAIRGDVTVIAGSTTPVITVVDKKICAPNQRIWTSSHIIPGLWTMESNATLSGAYIEWAIGLLCERAENPGKCRKTTYDNLDMILKDVPPGSNETTVGLGPSIMDCRRITDVPLARMFFPQPALPQVIPLDSAAIIHAVFENIIYAVRGNVEQLEDYSEIQTIKTVGGITRSSKWAKILANVLGGPVKVPTQPEGSLLGAGICASVGIGWYKDLEEASEEMVSWHPRVEPDEKEKDYQLYYSRWREACIGSE